MTQLQRHRRRGRLNRFQRVLVEISGLHRIRQFRFGLRTTGQQIRRRRLHGRGSGQHCRQHRIGQPALEHGRNTPLPGPEQQHTGGIEQRMEQGQLQQIIAAEPGQPGNRLHQPGPQRQQGQGQGRGHAIEQHMHDRQPLATALAAEHADHRRADAAAQVGTNCQRQRLVQPHLAQRQRRQHQHQGGVAGLHDHRRQQADAGKQQHAANAAGLHRAQVHTATQAGKAQLEHVDGKEDEHHADQHPAGGTAALAGESGQHREHQQRQRQRRQADAVAEQGQQPDATGGAQVGAQNDGDAAGELDQARAQKGNGQQRHQRAGLQQHGAANAEQQRPEARAGTARQQLLQAPAGQLPQTLLQALHAEQEQRQAGAKLQPACAQPERPAQQPGHGQHRQHTQTHCPPHSCIRKIPIHPAIVARRRGPGTAGNFTTPKPEARHR